MASGDVELARRFVAVWNTRDIEAIIACSDESIEVQSSFAAVGGAEYHGHEGLRSYHRDLEDAWDEIQVDVEAYFDLGGHTTLGFAILSGRGRQSGVEARMPIATVMRWRDGLAVYFKAYADRDDALQTLGVTENELEPIAP